MSTLNAHYVTTPGPDTQATVDLYIDNPDAIGGGGGSTPGDNSITTTMLQDGAVTAAKIASGVIPGNASASKPGLVKQAAAISDLSAAPTQQDFNGLLAALRTAGILASA